MMPELHVLDTVRRLPPLGMRLRDPITGVDVGDGLSINLWPSDSPSQRRSAQATPGGTWIARKLPGLHAFESGQLSDPSAAPLRPFTVEVEDAQQRFLPFSFQVQLPRLGLLRLEWLEGAPPAEASTLPALPLFSSSTRQVSPWLAAVRAELWDEQAQAPAAGAILQVTCGEVSGRGQADSRGRAVLFLPYPAPLSTAFVPGAPGAPPPSLQELTVPWESQTWPVSVTALYSPRPASALPPDLIQTLAQPSAQLWSSPSGAQDSLQRTLRLGRELVVRTEGEPHSRLWLTPAGP